MNSRATGRRSGSGSSLAALAIGLAAGVAAGLLVAPMRGRDMRATLRSRADAAIDRARMRLERRRPPAGTGLADTVTQHPETLTATLGEIALDHSGGPFPAEAKL